MFLVFKLCLFSYELSDGQIRQEVGMLMNKGTPNEELVVMGMYSFIGDDNNTYITMYRADRNGYQPKIVFKRSNRDNLIKSLVGWPKEKPVRIKFMANLFWKNNYFWPSWRFNKRLQEMPTHRSEPFGLLGVRASVHLAAEVQVWMKKTQSGRAN